MSGSSYGWIGVELRQRSEQQLRPTRCTMGLSDSENSLKQVVQLCSTLAEKGFSFKISIKSLGLAFALESTKAQNKKRKRRSPSYYKRQAKRRLLKKKPDTTAVPHDSCSLDLDPIPDRDLFGVKQSAEEESASDSEDSGSGSDTSSVTSKDQKAALETLEYEEKEPETGKWKLVTRQVLRGRHLSRRKYPFPAVPYLAHAGGTRVPATTAFRTRTTS